MGTFLSVEGRFPVTPDLARSAINEACDAVGRVDRLMHPSLEGSDLPAISSARLGELVQVDCWTFEVLALAQALWRASEGSFDPCLPEQAGRMGDLGLEAPDLVRRCGPRVSIDLGGIAIGFAIDRAVDALKRLGCVSGMVNIGGDLRVFGAEARTLQIRVSGVDATRIVLCERALAVSEPRSASSPGEHRGFYSPIGLTYVTGRTVAVTATTAMVADALTKCAILCAPHVLLRMLEQYDARLLDIPAD